MNRIVHIDFRRGDRIFGNRSVVRLEFKFRTVIDIRHLDSEFHFVVEVRIDKIPIGILRGIANFQCKLVSILYLIIKDNTLLRINHTRRRHVKDIGITTSDNDFVFRKRAIGIVSIKVCKLSCIAGEKLVFSNLQDIVAIRLAGKIRSFVDVLDFYGEIAIVAKL